MSPLGFKLRPTKLKKKKSGKARKKDDWFAEEAALKQEQGYEFDNEFN